MNHCREQRYPPYHRTHGLRTYHSNRCFPLYPPRVTLTSRRFEGHCTSSRNLHSAPPAFTEHSGIQSHRNSRQTRTFFPSLPTALPAHRFLSLSTLSTTTLLTLIFCFNAHFFPFDFSIMPKTHLMHLCHLLAIAFMIHPFSTIVLHLFFVSCSSSNTNPIVPFRSTWWFSLYSLLSSTTTYDQETQAETTRQRRLQHQA